MTSAITGNKQSFAIIIIIKEKIETKKLFTLSLYFGRFTKIIEKFQKAGPSSIYISYC